MQKKFLLLEDYDWIHAVGNMLRPILRSVHAIMISRPMIIRIFVGQFELKLEPRLLIDGLQKDRKTHMVLSIRERFLAGPS
jgi:hypothetical protein